MPTLFPIEQCAALVLVMVGATALGACEEGEPAPAPSTSRSGSGGSELRCSKGEDAYNLIRLEMDGIAEEADVAPNRISFMMAMRFIRDEWHWCAVASPGSIPKKLKRMRENVAQFVSPPRRSLRRYPRAVKIKMCNYKKKRTAGGPAKTTKRTALGLAHSGSLSRRIAT